MLHAANYTDIFSPLSLNSKKKLTLTVSVHTLDEKKKRTSSKITHEHVLETKLLDIIKKADPKFDISKYVVLLPVPVRPLIVSKNAPLDEVSKKSATPAFVPPMQIPKPKPLPKAHSSLPMKPAWLADATPQEQIVVAAVEPEPVVEQAPKRQLPKAGPREAWLVDAQATLKDALKGTSILEWPEFELWPEELAREEVEAERLEYAERRKVFDRDDWKRKREAEENSEDEEEEAMVTKKASIAAGDASSDSSSSVSSSTGDEDSDSSDDEDGEPIPNAAMQIDEKTPVEAAAKADLEDARTQ